MFYTIYKTTNLVNGKFFIGMHKTNNLDDGYVGSGKLLKQAIKKYGIENFITEHLLILDSEDKMKIAEKILVILDPEVSYNLCEGGKGGWGFVNRVGKNKKYTQEERKKGSLKIKEKWKNDPEWANRQREKLIPHLRSVGCKSFLGKRHSDHTKRLIGSINSVHQTGSKNSQYGTCWITNGLENKKIKKEELDKFVELGYYRGRVSK